MAVNNRPSTYTSFLLPLQGPWLELYDKSKFASHTPQTLDTKAKDSSDLVNYFLSKLGQYEPEDEDFEGTDSGYNLKEEDLVPLLSLETGTLSLTPYHTTTKRDSDVLSDVSVEELTKVHVLASFPDSLGLRLCTHMFIYMISTLTHT